MLIGYTTWGMPDLPCDTALKSLSDMGFDAVELTVLPGYTTALETLDHEGRHRIKQLYTRHGLNMPAIAAHRSLIDENPDQHDVNMKILTDAIDLCQEWSDGEGLPVMDTVLGGCPDDWDEKHEFILDRVWALVKYAREKDVVIGMEAHVGAALDTAEKSVQLVEEIDSPHLRLNFDISHFDILGMSIPDAVAMMAPYAAHTHVKDQRGRLPDFEFLIPGEGTFDFTEYVIEMQKAGYTGSITAEVSKMVQDRQDYDPIAAAEMCYRTLERAFREAGIERH